MSTKRLCIALLLSLFSITLFAQLPLTTSGVYNAMKKVSNWQMDEIERKGWRFPPTDWTNGAYYAGQMAWAKMANDERPLRFLKAVGELNQWKGGPERFFADDYCVGQTYAELFEIYKDSFMIKPMIELGDDIIKQPHNESLLWNFNGGLHNREWAWCDALFMGPPTLGYIYKITSDKKYLDIMNQLWWKATNYLYDTTEHLYYRDSRFFGKKEKNGTKVFWSRGNGWVIAGIARILNNMPSNYPDRKKYEAIFKAMAKRIAALQQPDGTWHASLLDPMSYPPKETSGTGFFTYALAWGINHGYLSYNDYFPTVKKAWDAMIDCVHENGKLGFVQVPGAAPEKVTFNDTEVYGTGAFLLAGTEIFELLYQREKGLKIRIKNTTAIDRRNEISELNWNSFSTQQYGPKNTTIINAQTGEEVTTQFLFNSKNKPVKLLLQSGTSAGSTAYYIAIKQKPKPYASKTFGRIVPERMDDFAWENDRIAFRMYGPALQKSGEISNGIDIWCKRTNALIIDKWYKGNDYHHDHGEGCDFYGVGKTLGAGGVAPFINNTLYPSQNFIRYKVLENGPLRTQFELVYESWDAAGMKMNETKKITLDAGSFLNKVEVKYGFSASSLPIAIGVAIIPGEGRTWNQTGDHGILAYQQPMQENGQISVGVFLPQAATAGEIAMTEKDHYNHSGHYILQTTVSPNKPLMYYQGAAWDREGTFKNMEDWQSYLQQQWTIVKTPLVIKMQH